jgi:hypothetical protein
MTSFESHDRFDHPTKKIFEERKI